MELVKFGSTGLEVSKLALGCMTFGDPARGTHVWTLPEDESRAIIRQAVDAGINFFDTANVYSAGTSEEIVGRALRDLTKRDEVVIATKVFYRMRPGANGAGLSRKAIFTAVDQTLKRLGTDYIDLYQIHRWDDTAPIEETLEALHDIVKAGKVRYIGASSMYAWQFAKALYTSRLNGWTQFASMQNHLNLLYREEEREMLPLCEDQGIAVIPWSPLARGRLTRNLDETSGRQQGDDVARRLYDASADPDKAVINAVAEIAATRKVPRAQIALAWVAQKPSVVAPIIGISKQHQLTDAIAALNLKLSDDELAAIEGPYVPHRVAGIKW